LPRGGTALDAVVRTITIMEDSGLFNAGLGGILQLDGVRRLDASLMEGKTLKAGCVIGLERIRNPIQAAKLVMKTPHVMLTNLGAQRIVKGLAPLPEPDAKTLAALERAKKKHGEAVRIYEKCFSTVGAVALDSSGNLAAGTSTGGTSAMLPGRVGDSPVIGAGTYADNAAGAVSCTGAGEFIIRFSLAKEICMHLKALSPARAARSWLKRLFKTGGEAGLIVLNAKGQFAVRHTTPYMAAGYRREASLVVREGFQKV
jgi:beta-aspartyl-peptidase (threonine type)